MMRGGSIKLEPDLCVQATFSSACQPLKTPPQSVALVGHSMGGVVARALYTLPRFNTDLVRLIITQASPHLAPVLALDPYLLGNKHVTLTTQLLCSVKTKMKFVIVAAV